MAWVPPEPPQGEIPPLSFSLPTKLISIVQTRVPAALELEFFDLLAQPISVAETLLVYSPVCDSFDYPSRILFSVVFLEYFAAVCCWLSELACLFYA